MQRPPHCPVEQDWGTLFPSSSQGASGDLVGFKASLRDFPVPLMSSLPSDAGLSLGKQHGKGEPGTPPAHLPMEPRFPGRNPPTAPSPLPELGLQGKQSNHILMVHMVWGEQASERTQTGRRREEAMGPGDRSAEEWVALCSSVNPPCLQ